MLAQFLNKNFTLMLVGKDLVDIGEDKIVKIGKERVTLRIKVAFLEPVITEPRRRLDQGPPFIRKILNHPIGKRDEHWSVGIQS